MPNINGLDATKAIRDALFLKFIIPDVLVKVFLFKKSISGMTGWSGRRQAWQRRRWRCCPSGRGNVGGRPCAARATTAAMELQPRFSY